MKLKIKFTSLQQPFVERIENAYATRSDFITNSNTLENCYNLCFIRNGVFSLDMYKKQSNYFGKSKAIEYLSR